MSEAPSADVFKATSAVILFSIAAAGGILPQRLQNVGSKVVSCLNTAAGGVFFASAMVRATRNIEQPLHFCTLTIIGHDAFVTSSGRRLGGEVDADGHGPFFF